MQGASDFVKEIASVADSSVIDSSAFNAEGSSQSRDGGPSASTSGAAPVAEAWQIAWSQAAPHVSSRCS